jgi:hypothetical protein
MPVIARVAAICVLGAFVALVAATTYRRARHDLTHPFVLFNGVIAYFVLVPAFVMLTAGYPSPYYGDPFGARLIALSVLFTGYIAILAGYLAVPAVRRWSDTKAPGGPRPLTTTRFARLDMRGVFRWLRTDSRLLARLGLGGFGLGAAFYVFYVVINGGFIRLITVTPRLAFQTVPNTMRFRWLALIGLFGGLVTVGMALRERVEPGWPSFRPRDAALLAVVGGGTLFAAVTFRARMLIAILAAYALVYAYTAGWLSDRRLIEVGVATVAAVGVFSFIEAALLGGTRILLLVRGFIQFARLDAFVGLVQHVPSDQPYALGGTFVGAIPIQWPGQPPTYGQFLDIILDGDKPHHVVSAMLPGELYVNFGVVGLLVGSAVFGTLLYGVTRLRNAGGPIARGLYPALVVTVVLAWPTNVFWTAKGLVLRLLVPPLLAIAVARWYQRSDAPTRVSALADRLTSSERP